MELYSIKKGRFYSNGNRLQPIIWPLILLIIGVTTSIIFSLFIPVLLSIVVSTILLCKNKKRTIVYSKRINFSANCLYRLPEGYDQVNKLFGFSEGFHHWNSARIGWRCIDGAKIELLAYCYVDGERIIKPLLSCKPNTWIFCNIQNQDTKYVFKVFNAKEKLASVSVEKRRKMTFYSLFKLFIYNLYPYFGGKFPAPRDMNIYMISLK